ncbi:MAG TPA: alpha-ribazole-5-phosphate synthase, partial [Firmicutes bacterium]|nr:alpha-ribazole-5-phosphate synthase [Bacillota bacterium]
MSSKYRDLTLVSLTEDCVLVIACDSAGGIGPKELDSVKVPGYVLGRFTARVALMELL